MARVYYPPTQTRPAACHFPGPRGTSINFMDWFSNYGDKLPPKPVDNLALLSMSNGRSMQNGYAESKWGVQKPWGVLERSAKLWGAKVEMIGDRDQPFYNYHKIKYMIRALERRTEEYVLAADSCDTILTASPAEALQKFREEIEPTGTEVLFNGRGSNLCWPILPKLIRGGWWKNEHRFSDKRSGRAMWLNAGLVMGRRDRMLEFYNYCADCKLKAGDPVDDQPVIGHAWHDWHPRVDVDRESRVLYCGATHASTLEITLPPAKRQKQLGRVLLPLSEKKKPMIGVEIGVAEGYTSNFLLQQFPHLFLYMVDPWKPYEHQYKDEMSTLSEEQHANHKKLATWLTQPYDNRCHLAVSTGERFLKSFGGPQFDFIFIDANHLYEQVQNDIALAWPKVVKGGMLLGHDYGVYGDAHGDWGVKRAVDEFITSVSLHLNVGDDGIWWLRKPKD